MGSSESKSANDNGGFDNSSVRNSGYGGVMSRLPNTVGSFSKAKLPMPEHGELEERFAEILVSKLILTL